MNALLDQTGAAVTDETGDPILGDAFVYAVAGIVAWREPRATAWREPAPIRGRS